MQSPLFRAAVSGRIRFVQPGFVQGIRSSTVNLAKIENMLFVLSQEVGVSAYDFDFDLHFACDHPYRTEGEHPYMLRVGSTLAR